MPLVTVLLKSNFPFNKYKSVSKFLVMGHRSIGESLGAIYDDEDDVDKDDGDQWRTR